MLNPTRAVTFALAGLVSVVFMPLLSANDRKRGGTTSLKKAARNAPKCRASRLCRAGVFVPVVAKPIQDTSEVSIPIKTVGIRLSRLWCGAEVVPGPAGHPNEGLLYSFLCT